MINKIIFLVFAVITLGGLADSSIKWDVADPSATVCKGQDADLNWSYSIATHDVKVSKIEWINRNQVTMATSDVVNNTFDQFKEYTGRLTRSKANAGIILRNVSSKDSGLYTVRVILKDETVSEKNGSVKCLNEVAPVIDQTGFGLTTSPLAEDCTEIRCGNLSYLGDPPVSFEMKIGNTSLGSTLNNGTSVYKLCEINQPGNLSCRLSGSALECLPNSHCLRKTYVIDLSETVDAENSSDHTAKIIGGVLGGVAVCVLIAVVIIIYRRKKTKKPRRLHQEKTYELQPMKD